MYIGSIKDNNSSLDLKLKNQPIYYFLNFVYKNSAQINKCVPICLPGATVAEW